MKNLHEFLLSNLNIHQSVQLTESELKKIIESNSEYLHRHTESNNLKHFFQQEYQEFSLALDCLIYWNITLVHDLFPRCPDLKGEGTLSNLGYFTQLILILTNNLIAIKSLFENGLDTQSKAVFRNSIELADLAVVVLYDYEYFLSHSSPQPNKQGNPFVSPKNYTIASKAKDIILTLHALRDQKDVAKVEKYWEALRKDQYEILSESSHGNFLHNIANSYKIVAGEKKLFIPSLGGNKWLDMDRVLSDICLHHVSLKRHITWILDIKHKVNLFDNASDLHRFIYYLDTAMAIKLYPTLVKPQSDPSKYFK